MLYSKNLYHPFSKSSFGLLVKNVVHDDNVIGTVINDINLYYQPVQIPFIAIFFIALKLMILVAGGYLHVKVFRLMKKESGILRHVTQLFVFSQMVFWPFLTLFTALTDFIHPMNEVVGQWFCNICSFLFYFLGNIITSHSFISALMRYFFIVHREMVNGYGRERIKRIFFILYFILPLFMAIWEVVDGTELDAMSFINKCNGKHHKVFLLETSTMNVARRNFCGFEDYDDSESMLRQIRSIINRLSCVVNRVIMIVMGLNISEGLLYYQIWSHIYREEKEMVERLKSLLTEKSKTRRNRNITMNLQIAVLGWLVEVFGFLTCVIGVYILGHGNSVVTMTLHTLAMTIYSIFLPCSILINSEEVKEYIFSSQWYSNFIDRFGLKTKESSTSNDQKEEESRVEAGPNLVSDEDITSNSKDTSENEPSFELKKGETGNADDTAGKENKTENQNDVIVTDLESIDTEQLN